MWRRGNKFGNRRAGGFDSGLERALYTILLQREKDDEISEIKRQQTVELQGGPRSTRITWRADFSFIKNSTGDLWYAEAKGFPNDVWPLKLKMIRYQKIKTEIWGGSASRLTLIEVVE